MSADLQLLDFHDIRFDGDGEVVSDNENGIALASPGPTNIYSFDISDPNNLTLLQNLSTTFRHSYEIGIDVGRQLSMHGGFDGWIILDYSAPSNLSVQFSEAQWCTGIEARPGYKEGNLLYLNVRGRGQFEIWTYDDPANPSQEGTVANIDSGRAVGVSETDDLALTFTSPSDLLHAIDVSDTQNPSELATFDAANYGGQTNEILWDSERNLFFIYGGSSLVCAEWDAGNTNLVKRSEVSPSLIDDGMFDYSEIQQYAYATVSSGAGVYAIDASDPDNLSVDQHLTQYPNAAKDLTGTCGAAIINAGAELLIGEHDNDYAATLETNVAIGPDKPTISVDATGDEYVDLSSSAYSHPNGVAHQDSRWQVRQASASNWTNPEYDSGFIGDLEAHTANPIPIEDDLEARVAHRDTNDALTWSDPVSLSTTGTIKQGEGPEGLFFGEKNGNRILRFGRAYQDDGTNIKATLESNHVAPAGAQGEAVFRALYITVETGTDVDFTFTPIIDGTEDTNAQVTHEHRPSSRTRDTIEAALAKDVTDSAGNPVAKVGLRGSWFGVKIEATDVLGSGNKVNLEGVELEVETVREQAGSVNEV